MGKQALLSLEKVVQERRPHTACTSAQNNWDDCAGGTCGAELDPASSWGWQDPGAGIGGGCDDFSQSCLSSGPELLPCCVWFVLALPYWSSTGIHEDSPLAQAAPSPIPAASRLLPWELAEPLTVCLGGSFREEMSVRLSWF